MLVVEMRETHLGARVGVHLPLAAGHGDVDEAAGVEDALVGAALGRLLLLLGLDLYHSISRQHCRSVGGKWCCSISGLEDSHLLGVWYFVWALSYLWCLRLDLSGTREGSVDLAHVCGCA